MSSSWSQPQVPSYGLIHEVYLLFKVPHLIKVVTLNLRTWHSKSKDNQFHYNTIVSQRILNINGHYVLITMLVYYGELPRRQPPPPSPSASEGRREAVHPQTTPTSTHTNTPRLRVYILATLVRMCAWGAVSGVIRQFYNVQFWAIEFIFWQLWSNK